MTHLKLVNIVLRIIFKTSRKRFNLYCFMKIFKFMKNIIYQEIMQNSSLQHLKVRSNTLQ